MQTPLSTGWLQVRWIVVSALGAALFVWAITTAAQSYPARPVRMVVPYPPGGGLDPIGRAIGQKLSMKDIVAQAKAQPGAIRIGLSGVGGVSHLTMELFRQKVGISLSAVPYRGAGAAMVDVANGAVPLIFSTLAAGKGLLDAGRLRALAVSTAKRSSALPDVPSLVELGYSGVEASLWIGTWKKS